MKLQFTVQASVYLCVVVYIYIVPSSDKLALCFVIMSVLPGFTLRLLFLPLLSLLLINIWTGENGNGREEYSFMYTTMLQGEYLLIVKNTHWKESIQFVEMRGVILKKRSFQRSPLIVMSPLPLLRGRKKPLRSNATPAGLFS